MRATGPVRMGVLGCADIAVRRVLPAIAAVPGVEAAVVASRDRSTAERVAAANGAAAVTGYDAVLHRQDVDAVYVPLPTALHAEWVERALLAGKHVLSEKPLSTHGARTAALVRLAATRGLVLRENFMFPFHSQHRRVLDLVEAGAIGELRSLNAVFTIPPRPDADIRYRPELGGGSLLDQGVYPLRAAQFFLGNELEVLGATLARDTRRGVDLGGAALLRSSGDVFVQVTFGMRNFYRAAYELCGSEGRITVERAYAPPADLRPDVRIERERGVEQMAWPPDDQYTAAMRGFAEAVRSPASRTDDPLSHPAVVLGTLVDDIRRKAG